MADINSNPGSVSPQPVSSAPIRKRVPLIWVLVAIVALIGIANLGSLIGGKGKTASKSNLSTQPSVVSPGQVRSYQATQANEVRGDAEARKQAGQQSAFGQGQSYPGSPLADVPGPEADAAAPMTAAQSQAIYRGSPNAPQRTSGAGQAHAEAKQRQLAREKEHQDALNSDTVAIDFSAQGSSAKPTAVLAENQQGTTSAEAEDTTPGPSASGQRATLEPVSAERGDHKIDPAAKADPMGAYPFDSYRPPLRWLRGPS